MAYIYDIADTWNASGTTFTGIKLNVTDTASAAGSLLMDLQVGGVSQLNVSKSGTASGSGGYSSFKVSNLQGMDGAGTSPRIAIFSGTNAAFGSGLIQLANTAVLAWGSGLASGTSGSVDLILARDAANTLAQRNGVNAQAFNIYNTFTDASNYERGFMRYVSNRLEIGHEGLGTGTAGRTVAIRTSGFDALTLTASAATLNVNLNIGSGSINTLANITAQSGFHEMVEMTAPSAPATNRVRIYAEDNGSGKTRLMALFPTGVAQQIAIEP